ncbi:GNAT family N-acetyltransferase [Streptomyces sp. HNM0645]|uniref:GNAT family N-acetyltransferase n=1 Tax=Streptomyces sp. HNM0645 TaxID=2782343 RepID=UPI0024B76CD2|nr:GNAT family N-acetyltransferase [Streptomyces sp. HNM0645]MDI9883340.1 GNAT family N-acetyltransferase [Streptomyces sp. HNM0645]
MTPSPMRYTSDVAPEDPRFSSDVRPLLRVLRPALTDAAADAFAHEAHRQGLVFTAAYEASGRCLGVGSHRVLATSRGRVLFIDDLVTDPFQRGAGTGAFLVGELTSRAVRAGCVRIELDSGVANHDAHRFYHAHRMRIAALHFAVDVPSP